MENPTLLIQTRIDRSHELIVESISVRIDQRKLQPHSGYEILELQFHMEAPARFQVDVLIPVECRNACVTLDEERVLDWFSDELPDFLSGIGCQDGASCPGCTGCGGPSERYSPLHPGRVQSLCFRWIPGDRLQFHFVLPE